MIGPPAGPNSLPVPSFGKRAIGVRLLPPGRQRRPAPAGSGSGGSGSASTATLGILWMIGIDVFEAAA